MNISARHVFEILRRVCDSDRPISATEIHQLLNLPSSTIHRALASLEEEGFIARYRGQPKYVIGPNPQHLAHALFSLFPLRRAMHSLLRDAAIADKQTVFLTMRVGWYGMKVAVLEGTNQVFHAGALGETQLVMNDGAGQAMLDAMGDAELSRMREFLELHWPGSGKTLSHAKPASDESHRKAGDALVDKDGWAWHHLPISDAAGGVIAAVSGGAPADAESGGDAQERLRNLAGVVVRIEAFVREKPALSWSPFGHLSPDEILLGPPQAVVF